MKKLFLLILGLFITVTNSYAAGVEDVYYDIDSNYEYKYELQYLYDKGMFLPSEDRLFNAGRHLTRDDFVSIVMEISCYKCIQPYTEFDVLQKYTSTKPFYDVGLDNKAYYCISLADDLDSVRGYDIGYECQDGTVKNDQRPFCVNNTITWEESVAVIMRNSGIFSIDDNLSIINQINAGVYFPDIGNISPKNPDGSANTFYGYFYKAQEYGITKIGADGNVRDFKLLENINTIDPKAAITKEDFLKMAFVAFESNSCAEETNLHLSTKIEVYENTCAPGEQCDEIIIDKDNYGDEYDFHANIGGACESGIKEDNYLWRYYNKTTGQQIVKHGEYQDNTKLTGGNWMIYLTVKDECGNTGEASMTASITEDKSPDTDLAIIVKDGSCNAGEDCITSPKGNIFDFEVSREDDGYEYSWTFEDTVTGETTSGSGPYIDNKEFDSENPVLVTVVGENDRGDKITDSVTVFPNIDDSDIDIIVKDGSCNAGEDCATSPTGNIFDLEVDNPKDNCEYSWSFRDTITGKITTGSGLYIDDIVFDSENPVLVTLDYICQDGETGMNSTTLYPKIENQEVHIEVRNENCAAGSTCQLPVTYTNVYDFAGISEGFIDPTYNWTFINPVTGESTTKTGDYIDNEVFDVPGVWDIILTVTGDNGASKSTSTQVIVPDMSQNDMSVNISASTLFPTGDTPVEFEAITSGGAGPYSYVWYFGNGMEGSGKQTSIVYQESGVYTVKVIVTDASGKTAESTITVTATAIDPGGDIDGDGVLNKDDLCLFLAGDPLNKGCPLIETTCKTDSDCAQGFRCEMAPGSELGACKMIPEGVSDCLYSPDITTVVAKLACNSCPCNNTIEFESGLRECDIIFPAITSPDGSQIYKSGSYLQFLQ